jgi:SAM-dependent methyltransferase
VIRRLGNRLARWNASRDVRRLEREYRAYASGPDFDPRIPPPEINYNQTPRGPLHEYIREFRRAACEKELPFLVRKAGLKPESTVLDYGCGLGRFANAASDFLTSGRYVGYEPNQRALRFLRSAYAGRSNFRFFGEELRGSEDYVGLQFGRLSSEGVSAHEVELKELEGLDATVQYSSSVFTHMWIPAIENVLRALRKAMAPGGVAVNSWLIVDAIAEHGMRRGIADRRLPHEVRGARTYSLDNPLLCTAYTPEQVKEMYRRSGHEIVEICWGAWSGRQHHNGAHAQDLVISRPC